MKTEANDTIYPAIGDSLTKREYFAAMAMQGFIMKEGWAGRTLDEGGENPLRKIIADASVTMADNLIEALNKPTPSSEVNEK